MAANGQGKISHAQGAGAYQVALLVVFFAVLTWSAIRPHDYFTWFLEVLPALVGLPILLRTYSRFTFTPLVYTLILLHAILLMVGGHYTYAEVPLGNWARDAFHLGRNHYDRVGHLAQGIVPALVAREVLLRRHLVKRSWSYFFVFSICMMITAMYELFEFMMAKTSGNAADAFLGSQGDVWDTQWDMTMCLIGCNLALLFMSGWQDRQIAKLQALAGEGAHADG